MRLIDFPLILDSLPFVLTGLPYTLGITLLCFLLATIWGFLLSRGRVAPWRVLRGLTRVYISIFRGVPMLIVLFMLYFGLPYFKVQLPALLCALIAFTLVPAAYIAEIFRAAMGSIDRGQWEAAQALGLPQTLIVYKIILPQALRIAIAPLSNVIVDMVKSTSLVAMITVPDIFQNAKIVGGREWDYMSMYVLVAAIYWTLSFLLERGQGWLERRFAAY